MIIIYIGGLTPESKHFAIKGQKLGQRGVMPILTIGKAYEGSKTFPFDNDNLYRLSDDNNEKCYVECEYFVSVQTWRDKQLNNLL